MKPKPLKDWRNKLYIIWLEHRPYTEYIDLFDSAISQARQEGYDAGYKDGWDYQMDMRVKDLQTNTKEVTRQKH